MTSYTDKHLAKAKDVLPRLFSDENVATTHDGEAAYVGDRCLAVIAEALADAERQAFKRAAEIARDVANKCMSRPLERDPQSGRLKNRMQRRYQECFSAGATSVYRAITSEMEGR